MEKCEYCGKMFKKVKQHHKFCKVKKNQELDFEDIVPNNGLNGDVVGKSSIEVNEDTLDVPQDNLGQGGDKEVTAPEWLEMAFKRFSMNGEIKGKEKPQIKELYFKYISTELKGSETCKYFWITMLIALKNYFK